MESKQSRTKSEQQDASSPVQPPPWLVRSVPGQTAADLHLTGRQLYLVILHGMRVGYITPEMAAALNDPNPAVTEERSVALVCTSGALESSYADTYGATSALNFKGVS